MECLNEAETFFKENEFGHEAEVIADSIKKLDSDIVADAYATFNTRLDSFLKRFPEYRLNDVITESIGQRHM